MLKSLLATSLCAVAMSFSAGALVPQAEVVKAKAKPSLVLKQQYGARKLVTKSVNPRYKEFGHGSYTLKAVPGVPRLFNNKVVNPLIPKHHRTVKAEGLPNGCLLFESFEEADLDNAAWLPEGWTLRSNGVDGENNADT